MKVATPCETGVTTHRVAGNGTCAKSHGKKRHQNDILMVAAPWMPLFTPILDIYRRLDRILLLRKADAYEV